MWSTCMFCNGGLGRNQVVETFPVGRRLAFDPAKGRLWVVCRRCERWNLTPLEERWEAIEDCERLFRDTRLRVSTEQVGLARLREGLELVRIGAPRRPEFAAWRYGDQFGRRRKRAIIVGTGVASVLGVGAMAGLATGVVSGTLLAQSGNFYNLYQQYRTAARLRTPAGELLKVKGGHLERARFVKGEGEGFDLEVEHTRGITRITGPGSPQVAGRLMAQVNRSGAKRTIVDDAVKRIEEARDPVRYLERTIQAHAAEPRFPAIGITGKPLKKPRAVDIPGSLARLDHPTRLAVEMGSASHGPTGGDRMGGSPLSWPARGGRGAGRPGRSPPGCRRRRRRQGADDVRAQADASGGEGVFSRQRSPSRETVVRKRALYGHVLDVRATPRGTRASPATVEGPVRCFRPNEMRRLLTS